MVDPQTCQIATNNQGYNSIKLQNFKLQLLNERFIGRSFATASKIQ